MELTPLPAKHIKVPGANPSPTLESPLEREALHSKRPSNAAASETSEQLSKYLYLSCFPKNDSGGGNLPQLLSFDENYEL